MPGRLAELSVVLNHEFQQPALLSEALTHRGAKSRHGVLGYERLEFLGDRVLGLVIADLLLRRFPDEAEGLLARRLTGLVRREACARVARAFDLGRYLRMSKGEDEAGGRDSTAILSDSCEAVIAALYLDGGLAVAARFIQCYWEPLLAEADRPPQDAKTSLQEWAQARGKPLPSYETVAIDGPPHNPTFSVAVGVEGVVPGFGKGSSKRAAEQAAAEDLLRRLTQAPETGDSPS